MSAPNMSLSTGFSPKPLGMIFSVAVPRRIAVRGRLVVRTKRRCVTGKPQVRDAGLEIIFEASERAWQDVGVIGADAGRQLARNRPRGRLIAEAVTWP